VVFDGQPASLDVTLAPARFSQSVVVTARRTEEVAQEVPIPVSVVRGDLVSDAGAFNVNRLKEMIPTVQFYSTQSAELGDQHPRAGAPFGLDQRRHRGRRRLYIDGVFYARPASATLDFLDVEQVEVLRGPQGTLFGRTRRPAPSTSPRASPVLPGGGVGVELRRLRLCSGQSVPHRPLGKRLAGRVSFSGTQRDGTLLNTRTGDPVNNLNNLGVRGQVLFAPSPDFAVTVASIARVSA
jgi:iron complex outermembrane receptor protein